MIAFSDPKLVIDVVRVFAIGTITFLVAFAFTPKLLSILRKYEFGKSVRNSGNTPLYSSLHAKKEGTPVGGGIIVWATVFTLAVLFSVLNLVYFNPLTDALDFLSRPQTILPLGALIASALVGLVDDYLNVRKVGPHGGGLRMKHRIWMYTVVAAFGAWWFFFKLGWDTLHVPGVGDYQIGWWYIPLFIFVIVASAFSVNEADGLDGLAGGILLFCYGAFTALSFAMGRIELSMFCAAIGGGLLAFLWFNVYPAKFFMGDTGAMSLGTTLGVIAMITNSALVLPIIAFPLVAESASVIIQVLSKKLFGRKVFLSAPLHHHFEALGWPESQVTMRAWIVASISAAIGLVIGLMGMGA